MCNFEIGKITYSKSLSITTSMTRAKISLYCILKKNLIVQTRRIAVLWKTLPSQYEGDKWGRILHEPKMFDLFKKEFFLFHEVALMQNL